jgi:hypothetical protein
VTVVQQWKGIKPSIKPLFYEFYIHLATMKLREVQGIKIKREPSGRKSILTGEHLLKMKSMTMQQKLWDLQR